MQSVNEIIKIIHNLPKDEQTKIVEILVEGEQQNKAKKENVQKEIERYKKARKWLDEHSQDYMNQWVCLEGDKLIAHSEDGRDLYQIAKDAGIEIPFIHHIVEEKYPFGGW